ncbi:MAG: cytochrome c [Burkholderiales bacterium]|nr:cytochrome c [Burkholderiales bacterium]
MKRLIAATALLSTTVAGLAFAQQKPEDEIRYRQSVMNVIGRAMAPMGAMAQGKAPFNAAVAQKNSALVETLLSLPWNSFGPGTDKGAPTKAAPKVWTEAAKFREAAENSQKAVANLAAAAKTGDEGKFKAAFAEVPKSCNGGCHDDFRLKEFRN